MYEDEIWSKISFLKDYYEVSNYGRVKTRGKLRPLTTHPLGHTQSSFIDKSGKPTQQKIHRLVALAFVPNQDPIHNREVNHIDGNRSNNYYKNLEWVTRSQIMKHASVVLYGTPRDGNLDWHDTSVHQFSLDGKFIKKWYTARECALEIKQKGDSSTIGQIVEDISACASHRSKTAHGYIFSYAATINLEDHKHKEPNRCAIIGTHKKDGSELHFASFHDAEGFVTKDGKKLSGTLICACIKGRGRSSHAGYTWKYENS